MALPILAVDLPLASVEQFDQASVLLSAWLKQRHGVRIEPFSDLHLKSAGLIPHVDSRFIVADAGRVWRLEVRHLGHDDPSWEWSAVAWLVEERAAAWYLRTRVSVANTHPGRISAPNLAAGRPAFVGQALRELDIRVDGVNPGVVQRPSVESMTAFVAWLESPDRRLPAVMLSEAGGGAPDADRRAIDVLNRLGGITHVVRTGGRQAWEFSRLVGKERSCFLGAMRLYWPGSITEAEPVVHPVTLATSIAYRGWDAVLGDLVRQVGTQAAAAIGPPDLERDLRAAARRLSADAAVVAQRQEKERLRAL